MALRRLAVVLPGKLTERALTALTGLEQTKMHDIRFPGSFGPGFAWDSLRAPSVSAAGTVAKTRVFANRIGSEQNQ